MHMRPRRGFIILFGTKSVVKEEEGPRVRARCPQCGAEAEFIAKSHRQWFTAFFIPIFPISGKHTFSQCMNCATTFRVPPESIRRQAEAVDAGQNQRAIGLYNSLRASPGNSITLFELMQIYGAMGEFDSAISAAGEFQNALNSSEQCMVMLGRMYLGKKEFPEAIQWFDAAIGRQGNYADAHFWRGVALMEMGRVEEAQQAGRMARNLGHPEADRLLDRVTQG